MDYQTYNIACIVVSLFLLIAYTLSSYIMTLLFPKSSFKMQLAKTTSTSLLWVRKHREKDDAATMQLAIHTFRNTILIAIFMGGVSLQGLISAINLYGTAHDTFERTRLMIITVSLILSFLAWASVIRSSSHLGYMTGVLNYNDPSINLQRLSQKNNNTTTTSTTQDVSRMNSPFTSSITDDRVKQEQDKRLKHESHIMYIMLLSFSLGFRFLFISIPFYLYIVGPEALVISTFFLLVFMYIWDYIYTFNRAKPLSKTTSYKVQ